MHRLFLLTSLALVACGGHHDGIAVGNPSMTARVQPGIDVAALEGGVDIQQMVAVSCDGDERVLLEEVVIMLDGSTRLAAPEGDWCGMEFTLGGPVEMSGRMSNGGTFALELDVDRITVASDEPFEVMSTDLVLLLGPGEWLTASELELEPDGHLEIGPGSVLHDKLSDLIADESLLCEDHNANGLRDRDDAVLAAGPAAEDGR